MEAPLVDRSSADLHLIGDDGDYLPATGLKAWWRIFCIESVKLWGIGGPIAFQIVCESAIESIATMFVGHLGDTELAAFSIALSVITTFAFGVMEHEPDLDFELCVAWDGKCSRDTMWPGICRVFSNPKVSSSTEQSLCACVDNISCNDLTNFPLLALHLYISLGTTGAAVAFDITSWGVAIAQYIYVVCWCTDGWKGYSWSAFNEIWAFVRLSIASAIMQCLEIWYMSSIVILTGHLNNSVTAVGSLSICMNVNNWELMVFIGINAAIKSEDAYHALDVRVSNELGSGHSRATKYSVYVTVVQSLLIGILCMIIVLATRNHLAIIFTDSKDMQRAVTHLSGLLAITMLLNSVQPVISGVAIGGGWQALVAYINLACYYIFGLPLGYALGYVADMGVMGLWGGMVAGMALQTLLLLLMLYRTNWNDEVEKTTERISVWGGQDIVNGR
ncbi:protein DETOXIFICATION 35 [Sesamum angolense]|uniref:Protein DETOXIFICATION n=1 Tax=Sesamum angolense TaxID=2727404 RepID=A0AAE1VZH9_9LAMI|nr:protein DETOXIFICATION 35 [Sesamum angolense]